MRLTVATLRKIIKEAMYSEPEFISIGDAFERLEDEKIFKVINREKDIITISSSDEIDEIIPIRRDEWEGEYGTYVKHDISSINVPSRLPKPPRPGFKGWDQDTVPPPRR